MPAASIAAEASIKQVGSRHHKQAAGRIEVAKVFCVDGLAMDVKCGVVTGSGRIEAIGMRNRQGIWPGLRWHQLRMPAKVSGQNGQMVTRCSQVTI